jgi:hypothetical protein
MKLWQAYPKLRAALMDFDEKCRLEFVYDDGKRILSSLIGSFIPQPDGTFSFKFSPTSLFKQVLESDDPIETFVALFDGRMNESIARKKPERKEPRKVVELKKPSKIELICLEPTQPGRFKALFLDSTPIESQAVKDGFCESVSGGIIENEAEITVGVAQQTDSGTIYLQLDVESLLDLIKGGKNEIR